MFTFYYDINENFKQYPRIVRQTRFLDSMLPTPLKIGYVAERIWREDHNTGEVTFVKHRQFPPDGYVLNDDDIKEFRWIKLKAVEL